MGVVVAAALIDAVVLVIAALIWRFFGHQLWVFVRRTDLRQIARRIWSHRTQLR
jgi:hypothetical protein